MADYRKKQIIDIFDIRRRRIVCTDRPADIYGKEVPIVGAVNSDEGFSLPKKLNKYDISIMSHLVSCTKVGAVKDFVPILEKDRDEFFKRTPASLYDHPGKDSKIGSNLTAFTVPLQFLERLLLEKRKFVKNTSGEELARLADRYNEAKRFCKGTRIDYGKFFDYERIRMPAFSKLCKVVQIYCHPAMVPIFEKTCLELMDELEIKTGHKEIRVPVFDRTSKLVPDVLAKNLLVRQYEFLELQDSKKRSEKIELEKIKNEAPIPPECEVKEPKKRASKKKENLEPPKIVEEFNEGSSKEYKDFIWDELPEDFREQLKEEIEKVSKAQQEVKKAKKKVSEIPNEEEKRNASNSLNLQMLEHVNKLSDLILMNLRREADE